MGVTDIQVRRFELGPFLANCYLLIGPSFNHHAQHLPLGWVEVAVAVGFFGLLAAAVTGYFKQFPELLENHRFTAKEV